MNLNQLSYFQTVARLQHYGKAAETLNISQPSLSKSISNLEEELGLYLFEKSGRNVVLTKYGQVFLDHVDRILSEVETATKKMRQLASPEEGHVDIAYVSPLAKNYIPQSVRRFRNTEQNQQITFSFSTGMTSVLLRGLRDETYDVVFGSYVENESSLEFFPILKQAIVLIVPKSHLLAGRKSVTLEELAPYPFIAYERSSGCGLDIRKLFQDHHFHPAVVCESPDESSITELVAMEIGISLVADVSAIHHPDVCVIPLEEPRTEHTVYMIYHKYRYLTPAVLNFIQFIKKQDYSELE